MAISSTVTKLSLANWAKYMGIHPLHFQQVRINSNQFCSNIIFQHEWQTSDHVSREEIAQAIAEAENKIENALGYRLAPSWEVDEWTPTIRPFIQEYANLNNADIRGMRQVVKAKWGHFISGGIRALELVDGARPIAWSDTDSDGYFETGTVTATTDVSDKNEICIFYPGKDGDEQYEIKPIKVVLSGGVATITFRRELAVKENIIEVIFPDETDDLAAADHDDDDDFLSTVDIYRRYNDPQTQASFLWEPFVGTCGACGTTGCPQCAYSAQTGCLLLRGEPVSSLVGYMPGDWNSDDLDFDIATWALAREPDIVRLYYYAGIRDKRQEYVSRMPVEWERTVAHMAASMLDRPPCDCIPGSWEKWKTDLSVAPTDEVRRIFYGTSADLENPFGTKLGEVEAWRKVRTSMIRSAVLT